MQISHLLTQTDVFNGNLKFVADADDNSALGRTVELRDGESRDFGGFDKFLSLVEGVLSG